MRKTAFKSDHHQRHYYNKLKVKQFQIIIAAEQGEHTRKGDSYNDQLCHGNQENSFAVENNEKSTKQRLLHTKQTRKKNNNIKAGPPTSLWNASIKNIPQNNIDWINSLKLIKNFIVRWEIKVRLASIAMLCGFYRRFPFVVCANERARARVYVCVDGLRAHGNEKWYDALFMSYFGVWLFSENKLVDLAVRFGSLFAQFLIGTA